jgi:hypothetical protein
MKYKAIRIIYTNSKNEKIIEHFVMLGQTVIEQGHSSLAEAKRAAKWLNENL